MNNDQQFSVQKIRSQYLEKEMTELDSLRNLDKKAKRPATLFGYIFGSIGAIILGAGMSLVMTDLGSTLGMANPLVPGILIGLIGLAMTVGNYPFYKLLHKKGKKKYAHEILTLSEKMMKQ